ncbi:hypothetical protein AJ78_04486 [Emergomyces pasteurianus Ep9510]|uniref:Asparagine-linked glycosylation protein 2 n=1 Tax=Emergomyces pasteurianus Ep9510 TaxID=1447872 RepID=A0A1J9PH40_9EURO|nr:hypothetical protein AJ78_04486 [Emergomyces pasteurianus Ep9510]
MQAGLPVLAVNNGGPLETIVEGKTGWLRAANAIEEWTNVMRKVLWETDAQEAAIMSSNAKSRVEREFSLQAMGDRLEAEIQEMFDKEPRPFYGWWDDWSKLRYKKPMSLYWPCRPYETNPQRNIELVSKIYGANANNGE